MKYITYIILGLLVSNSLTGTDTPKTDSLSDYKPSYMYIYPEVRLPTCSPGRISNPEWWEQKREIVLRESAQNALFYAEFKEKAKRERAYVYSTRRMCHSPANAGLSRTVLNISFLGMIEQQLREESRGGPFELDGLFINYSHADDYSLLGTPCEELPEQEKVNNRKTVFSRPTWGRLNGWRDCDFSDYSKANRSKKNERIYVLNRLQKIGAKVYIYNKFYNVPDYIKNHENVEMLRDKDSLSEPDWTPDYYSWTNFQGRKINAGFLHIPFKHTLGVPLTLRESGQIALKVNNEIFNYNFRYLSPESQKLAISLIGSYSHELKEGDAWKGAGPLGEPRVFAKKEPNSYASRHDTSRIALALALLPNK